MSSATARGMIGHVALKLTKIREEDIPFVIDFVDYLERRGTLQPSLKTTKEIVAEAKRRAELLADVPREEIVAEFEKLVEEVRQEAIDKGTAIDGDLESD